MHGVLGSVGRGTPNLSETVLVLLRCVTSKSHPTPKFLGVESGETLNPKTTLHQQEEHPLNFYTLIALDPFES